MNTTPPLSPSPIRVKRVSQLQPGDRFISPYEAGLVEEVEAVALSEPPHTWAVIHLKAGYRYKGMLRTDIVQLAD